MWNKYNSETIKEFIQQGNPLFCEQSKVTGYARCRGICCDKCSQYSICNWLGKCTIADRDYCIRDIEVLERD